MILYKETKALKKEIDKIKKTGKKVGFVPTMGALHGGHISLINSSIQKSDCTVCSIFINPTQFNDAADFEKYPKTIENDISLLEKAGCNVLFVPAVAEIYPGNAIAAQHYDLGEIETTLEGKYRPGHFQGVCQVMQRLVEIVNPDSLFIGQKDYQQCIVIKQLLRLIGHTAKVNIEETLREETGLAMSSRNLRLTNEQKNDAAGIYKMLQYIKANYGYLPISNLEKNVTGFLLTNGFNKVDYVSIADADTLKPASDSQNTRSVVALIAAFIGEVRLIDNIVLDK